MTGSRARLAGLALVFLSGLVVFTVGVWVFHTPHPFGADGHAAALDLTRSEIRATSPALERWLLHASDSAAVGAMAWGLLVMLLAVAWGIEGGPHARIALWVGGLPPLLWGAVAAFWRFNVWTVQAQVYAVTLAAFVVGMGLTHVADTTVD